MNAPERFGSPGSARCPGAPAVQDVIRADGDADRQPASYKLDAYTFLGDRDIPYERYTSREFFDLEMERMWTRTWQWACREEHIANAGDYYVYDIGPYSLIVTRTAQGEIKAYYNACLHRGTKLKPSFTEGYSPRLACPFHGWTWNLEGELEDLPCAWDFPHVDKANSRLPEARVSVWAGFVFVNLDENAMPLEEYLAPLPDHAAHADLADRYVALHVQKELPCNWKVASEAFMESYHTPVTHYQLQKGTGDINTQYDTFTPHVNRLFSLAGVASPTTGGGVSQQEIIDTMVLGDRASIGDALTVPEDGNARAVMASFFKGVIKAGGKDVDDRSISEIIDTVGYFAFPNGHFFLAPSFPIVYRFRPLGTDVDKALFDLLLLAPIPAGGRPDPVEAVRIGVDDSYSSVPGVDPALGEIYDQDTGNMGWMQEGMKGSKKRGATFANYQESRIRHMHQTLDTYLGTAEGPLSAS
ncbi:aromatic ring-hydroxylating oxygenase subunit alpha [Novosphingobium lentum]|uniref:aromatic ring-hydroxylating oxygenase subunit alpha n=1 Tax=Novosphingobium lentum TaxID=145287 RepID=UPI0008379E2A|nr:aromatic ring-hydroxylating dioxygenase subunit alpha [Novosphingobium lentum]